MTREEKIALLKGTTPQAALTREEKIAILKGTAAAPAPAPAPVAEPEPEKAPLDMLNTIRGGVQSLSQGQTLNWGDSIAGMGRAMVDPLIGKLTGNEAAVEAMTGQAAPTGITEKNWDMYAEDERANLDQFRKENPKTAFGLELGGGFASPVNFVAPGSTGLGKGASFAQRLRQGAGRGIIEGAIAGAGNADENRLGGALMGGAIGGALPFGVNVAVKEPWRQLTKRRIVQDLFEETRDEFGKIVRKFKTPIHMTGEHSTLVDLYRQVVGRAWGGKQVLGAQEAPIIEAAKAGAEKATGKAKILARTLNKTKEEIGVDARRATAEIDLDAKQAADKINAQYAEDTATVSRQIADAEAAGDLEKVAQLEAVGEMVDAGVEKEAMDLRALAATEAMPDDARLDILNGVDGDDLLEGPLDVNDPLAVNNRLIDWWRKRGFAMVKDKEFTWDEGLGNSVAREFGEDPGLAMALDDAPGLIAAMEKRFGMSKAMESLKSGAPSEEGLMLFDEFFKDSTLQINGDALMEMRNVFAKAANRGGDKSFAYRRIREKFDSLIRRQLDEGSVEAFDDQLARWTKRLTYEEATAAANTTRGLWTPEQYASASRKVAGKEAASRGVSPLYGETNTALERQAAAKAAGQRATTEATQQSSVLGKTRAAEKQAREAAAQQRKAQALEGVNEQQRLDKALAEAQTDQRLRDLDLPGQNRAAGQAAKAARDNAREIASRGIPQKASGLSALLTTMLLAGGASAGAVVGGPVGAAIGLGVGSSVGRGLAQPGLQEAMAGQLRSQQFMNQMLEYLNENAVAPAVQRTLTREFLVDNATED
jgi:hypothetical protein